MVMVKSDMIRSEMRKLSVSKKAMNCTLEVDNNLTIGGRYRHFKGGVYEIHSFSTCTQTGDTLVNYKSLSSEKLWSRPIIDFLGWIERERYQGARFNQLLF